MMRFVRLIAIAFLLALCTPIFSQDHPRRVYLCRSPLLAYSFWNQLQDLRTKGITLTPAIARQLCDHMKAGKDPQCIYVEMSTYKPIDSGWGGALAITDGSTRIWFHNPDAEGWVNPAYYVYLMNTGHS